jgi:nicotinamidase-related amidase
VRSPRGPSWRDAIPERDRAIAEAGGFGKAMGFGERPVLLIIDMNVAYCGDRPEPIEESMKRFRSSAGQVAWDAAERIRILIDAARGKRIPIVHTTGPELRRDGFDVGRFNDKNRRRAEDRAPERRDLYEIIPPLAPRPEDIVVRKHKYSAFFGTPLVGYLIDLAADTLVVCGTATGGCVRATVVDAFQLNFRVGVVEECVFDRFELSHSVNLFDMQWKAADVIPLVEALDYFARVPVGLFDTRMPSLRTPG